MMPAMQAQAAALSGVVVVLLLDFAAPHRAWAWLRLAQGSAAFRGVPGLQFCKVMGSGHGGGFSLRPSATHQGLVCMLRDAASAQAFCNSVALQACVSRAREHWLGTLAVTAIRGQWDQQSWGLTPTLPDHAPPQTALPVAALTRGAIRPAKAMQFWRHAPAAQAALGQAAGCQLAMGLGEAPLVRQCTFSLWDDAAALQAYAHHGAHRQAIVAAGRHDFFAESLFARLRVLSMSGTWQGRHYGAAPAATVAPRLAPSPEAVHG